MRFTAIVCMKSPKAGARKYEVTKAKKRQTTRLEHSFLHDYTTGVATMDFTTTRVVSRLSARIQQHTIASPPGLEDSEPPCPRDTGKFMQTWMAQYKDQVDGKNVEAALKSL
jgi:uncharacterized protein YqeY